MLIGLLILFLFFLAKSRDLDFFVQTSEVVRSLGSLFQCIFFSRKVVILIFFVQSSEVVCLSGSLFHCIFFLAKSRDFDFFFTEHRGPTNFKEFTPQIFNAVRL